MILAEISTVASRISESRIALIYFRFMNVHAAGEIIGGGPRAFQKYEAGDLLPSRAISSALTLLDHNPEGLTILRPITNRTSHHDVPMAL